MDQEGFLVNVRTAEVFFRFCARHKVTSREDRVAIMRELTRRKKAKYLRDVGEFTQGKNVMKVGFKPPHSPYDSHYCPDCGPKETK